MFSEVSYLFKIPDDANFVLYNYKDSVRFGEFMRYPEEFEDYWRDIWAYNRESTKFDISVLIENISNVTFLEECLTEEQAKDQFPEYFI
jgi:hypothetical protein